MARGIRVQPHSGATPTRATSRVQAIAGPPPSDKGVVRVPSAGGLGKLERFYRMCRPETRRAGPFGVGPPRFSLRPGGQDRVISIPFTFGGLANELPRELPTGFELVPASSVSPVPVPPSNVAA